MLRGLGLSEPGPQPQRGARPGDRVAMCVVKEGWNADGVKTTVATASAPNKLLQIPALGTDAPLRGL